MCLSERKWFISMWRARDWLSSLDLAPFRCTIQQRQPCSRATSSMNPPLFHSGVSAPSLFLDSQAINLSCVSDGPGILLDSDLRNNCCTLVSFHSPTGLLLGYNSWGCSGWRQDGRGCVHFTWALKNSHLGGWYGQTRKGMQQGTKCLFVDDSRKHVLCLHFQPLTPYLIKKFLKKGKLYNLKFFLKYF